MTTHRRALLLRVGAVVALAAGGLIGLASPAYADEKVDVQIPASTLSWRVGDPAEDLTAVVQNKTGVATAVVIQISLPGNLGSDVIISGRPQNCPGNTCTLAFGANGDDATKTLTWKLTSPSNTSLQPNQTKSGSGSVKASTAGGGNASDNFTINLTGPAQTQPTQAPAVPEVSGTVSDSATGAVLPGATVVMQDGANKQRQTGTDASGRFKFSSSANDPITPGTITVSATKDSYDNAQPFSQEGRNGQALSGIKLKMKPTAASASAAAPPTDEQSAPPSAGDTGGAANTTRTGNTSGPSMVSWLLIILGGLLVLFGIGAIVFLLRRRDDGDDGDEEPPNRRGPSGAPRPAYQGAGADPTMVSRTALGAPAMVGHSNANDATAIVRTPRMADDPYGPHTARGPATAAYPPAAPASPPGYGPSSGGGYGAGGGYDRPGAYGDRYGGGGYPPGDGYGPSSRPASDGYSASDYASGGGFGGPANGYPPSSGGPANGYAPSSGGGYNPGESYGERGGYGGEPHRYEPGGGGYDAGGPRAGSGYGQGAGSDYGSTPYAGPGGDYPVRGGYEPAAGYERERDNYSYDPYGSNEAPPARQSPPNRSERRPLDWLDD